MNKQFYITVDHLEDFSGLSNIRTGDSLTLRKELDNPYDDEAIAVYNSDNIKTGYVANSVDRVARGTYSAGRIYDKFESEMNCEVLFITAGVMICMC